MKNLYLCVTVAAGLCIGARADVPFRTGEVFGQAVKVTEGAAGSGRCVNVAGDLLYVGGKETLGVYSLAGDPLRPKLLGEAKDIASARQIALQDGMAYVTARANGIWIVDCRNPAKPFVAGHYPSTANCTGIDVAGDVCFVGEAVCRGTLPVHGQLHGHRRGGGRVFRRRVEERPGVH